MSRLAMICALFAVGCVNRFEAPYPTPDYVAVPRSWHTVRLEASGESGDEDCIAGNGPGQLCVVELRTQLERGLGAMLHNVGVAATPSDYVIRLDQLAFHLSRGRAGTQLLLSWHVIVEDERTHATVLASGNTETATTVNNGPLRDLFVRAEHDALVGIESRIGDVLARL